MNRSVKLTAIVLCLCLLLSGCSVKKQDEIDAMQNKIDTLEQFVKVNLGTDLESWDGSYIKSEQLTAYPLYDDTAIIEAYQSGDHSKLSEKELFVLATAEDILRSILLDDAMSDYEKEKAVYTHLVQRTNNAAATEISTGSYDEHTPYGVFYSAANTPLGNATTFKLLLGMMGIQSKVIRGINYPNTIAWNMVQLEGEWYHADLSAEFAAEDYLSCLYLNVTDEVMKTRYTWDFDAYPKATSTKYCPAYIETTKLKNVYELPQAIKAAIAENKNGMYVRFNDGAKLDYSILSHITPYLDNHYLYQMTDYTAPGENTVYYIHIETYDNDSTVEVPSYNWDMMQEAINEAFEIEAVG